MSEQDIIDRVTAKLTHGVHVDARVKLVGSTTQGTVIEIMLNSCGSDSQGSATVEWDLHPYSSGESHTGTYMIESLRVVG